MQKPGVRVETGGAQRLRAERLALSSCILSKFINMCRHDCAYTCRHDCAYTCRHDKAKSYTNTNTGSLLTRWSCCCWSSCITKERQSDHSSSRLAQPLQTTCCGTHTPTHTCIALRKGMPCSQALISQHIRASPRSNDRGKRVIHTNTHMHRLAAITVGIRLVQTYKDTQTHACIMSQQSQWAYALHKRKHTLRHMHRLAAITLSIRLVQVKTLRHACIASQQSLWPYALCIRTHKQAHSCIAPQQHIRTYKRQLATRSLLHVHAYTHTCIIIA